MSKNRFEGNSIKFWGLFQPLLMLLELAFCESVCG
jgi:hypothetical protein